MVAELSFLKVFNNVPSTSETKRRILCGSILSPFERPAQNVPQNPPRGRQPVRVLPAPSALLDDRVSDFVGKIGMCVEKLFYLTLLCPVHVLGNSKESFGYLSLIRCGAYSGTDTRSRDDNVSVALSQKLPQVLPFGFRNAELFEELQCRAASVQCVWAVKRRLRYSTNQKDGIGMCRLTDFSEGVLGFLPAEIVLQDLEQQRNSFRSTKFTNREDQSARSALLCRIHQDAQHLVRLPAQQFARYRAAHRVLCEQYLRIGGKFIISKI